MLAIFGGIDRITKRGQPEADAYRLKGSQAQQARLPECNVVASRIRRHRGEGWKTSFPTGGQRRPPAAVPGYSVAISVLVEDRMMRVPI